MGGIDILKIKNILLQILGFIFITTPVWALLIIFIILANPKPSNNIVICKNVQKLYKDDILFDNFYISCNDKTVEIGKELYTRIIENKDYKITYNNLGGIYLVEKIED